MIYVYHCLILYNMMRQFLRTFLFTVLLPTKINPTQHFYPLQIPKFFYFEHQRPKIHYWQKQEKFNNLPTYPPMA